MSFFESIAYFYLLFELITKAIPWIYEHVIGPMLGPKYKIRDFGEWALVTGATDGIGKSYAKQLAKEGLNIILISRTQAKLEAVASEIEKEYQVRTKIVAVDFSSGPEIYEKITNEIQGYNIGVLVNNVGVSYAYPEFFLDVANRDVIFEQINRCNILSVVNMCKIVLPHMVSNQKGIVVNIASMSGKIPQPLLAVYSASKAFVDKLSEDLNTEYSSHGIHVQSVLPGFVVTNMTKLRRSNLLAPTSDQYAESAIGTIGYTIHTNGYLPHTIMQLALTTLHSHFPTFSNFITLHLMKKIKRKAVRLNQKFAEKQKFEQKVE